MYFGNSRKMFIKNVWFLPKIYKLMINPDFGTAIKKKVIRNLFSMKQFDLVEFSTLFKMS